LPPLVALSAGTKEIGGLMRVRLNEAYVNAVRAAGLTPLVLPPLEPRELDAVASVVDGVVLTGGEDVDPSEYGEERGPMTTSIHRRRDQCELALARLAHERRIPTLAICRGIQLVNVAFGGSLIQDITLECPSPINHDQSKERETRVHDVTIEKGSMLAAAVGETGISVNSSHHQAVARIADGLRVTARAPDGIIEGAEWVKDDWWMLAVQWHPEELVRDTAEWDRGLFKAFAKRVLSQPASSGPRHSPGA
jgi:putative glutamine amidotransferase